MTPDKTREENFQQLYRAQCEEHELTYAKMNAFLKEANNLRSMLVAEQYAHEQTRDVFRKAFKEAKL